MVVTSKIALASVIAIALLGFAFLTYTTSEHHLPSLKQPWVKLPFEQEAEDSAVHGTKWALLVAGSKGYGNYRHQADVCHAYHILKTNGLKDENIIVMMYDDAAYDYSNSMKGILINKQDKHFVGADVYAGVTKDYTGDNVNWKNLEAILLGEKDLVDGGTGKVLDTKIDDTIFFYYSNHGETLTLGLPNGEKIREADLIRVLKKKRATGTFRSMVLFVEACRSGSMFHYNLPKNLGIYAITSANVVQTSYGAFCDGLFTNRYCVGDVFSTAWMTFAKSGNGVSIGELYEQLFRVTWVRMVPWSGEIILWSLMLAQ